MEDYYLSFADSVIKMTPQNPVSQDYASQYLLVNPMLTGRVSADKDDDDACEIASDSSGSGEEVKSQG